MLHQNKKPFTTDQCSVLSPIWRFIFKQPCPWEDLCVIHDKAYWHGGDKEDRRKADMNLKLSVWMRGYPFWAIAIYHSVRIGGHPIFPFPWRWNYGMPYRGRY